jgi:hypothetical protein
MNRTRSLTGTGHRGRSLQARATVPSCRDTRRTAFELHITRRSQVQILPRPPTITHPSRGQGPGTAPGLAAFGGTCQIFVPPLIIGAEKQGTVPIWAWIGDEPVQPSVTTAVAHLNSSSESPSRLKFTIRICTATSLVRAGGIQDDDDLPPSCADEDLMRIRRCGQRVCVAGVDLVVALPAAA